MKSFEFVAEAAGELKAKLEMIEAALLKNISGGTWSSSDCNHGDGSCYVCSSCTGSGSGSKR